MSCSEHLSDFLSGIQSNDVTVTTHHEFKKNLTDNIVLHLHKMVCSWMT